MELEFTSAKEACCPIFNKLKEGEELPNHVLQPHIPISSLPCPTEPLSLPDPPIEIRSGPLPYDIKAVANLWSQLLSIHIQNGNFVRYDDIVRNAPNTKAFVEMKSRIREEQALIRALKKIQDGLLPKYGGKSRRSRHPPEDWEFKDISDSIKMLEEDEKIDPRVINNSKICETLQSVVKLKKIPQDERFNFRTRCKNLLSRFTQLTESNTSDNGYYNPEPVEEEEEEEEVFRSPVCLIRMSPEQCATIEAIAETSDPPIDRAVIELICTLPYLTDSWGHSGSWDYCITTAGKLLGQPRIEISSDPKVIDPKGQAKLDRTLCYGPTLPPYMLQITEWLSSWYGLSAFLDTRTGEVFELKDFEPKGISGVPCEKFEGKSIGFIEDVLKEWIWKFLRGMWIPDGGNDIITDEWRSMYYIKHRNLLQNYNWPTSFPLPLTQQIKFLQQKKHLSTTHLNQYTSPTHHPMLRTWDALSQKDLAPLYRSVYNSRNKKKNKGEKHTSDFSTSIQQDQDQDQNEDENRNKNEEAELEAKKWLDGKISEAFKFYYEQQEDLAYSLEEGTLMLEKYRMEYVLGNGGASGDGWSVDGSPEAVMRRFESIVEGRGSFGGGGGEDSAFDSEDEDGENFVFVEDVVGDVEQDAEEDEKDGVIRDMKAFMGRAFELSRTWKWGGPLLEIPDDDSTGDFCLGTEEGETEGEGGCVDGSESQSDESDGDVDMEDLDPKILAADLKAVDLERVRGGLEQQEEEGFGLTFR